MSIDEQVDREMLRRGWACEFLAGFVGEEMQHHIRPIYPPDAGPDERLQIHFLYRIRREDVRKEIIAKRKGGRRAVRTDEAVRYARGLVEAGEERITAALEIAAKKYNVSPDAVKARHWPRKR